MLNGIFCILIDIFWKISQGKSLHDIFKCRINGFIVIGGPNNGKSYFLKLVHLRDSSTFINQFLEGSPLLRLWLVNSEEKIFIFQYFIHLG